MLKRIVQLTSSTWLILMLAFTLHVETSNGKRIHWKFANSTAAHLSTRENRIVGGQVAEEGFAPYQASLQTIFGSHVCGGVIIDKEWILTAGHCIEEYPLDMLLVIVGTNNFKHPGAVFEPVSAASHCMYDVPLLYHNDIAVLRLNASIEFNNLTQPIEMATDVLHPGDKLTLTGWGSSSPNSVLPEQLYKIDLNFISLEECQKAWNYDDGIDVGHICSFSRKGEGPCNGDSGGPLVNNGKVYGLVNWGAPCAMGFPDMHANVVYYRDFINLAMTQCMIHRT